MGLTGFSEEQDWVGWEDQLAAELARQPQRRAPQARSQPRRASANNPGGSGVYGSITDFGRMAAASGAAEQGRALSDAMNLAMGAINQENMSRVAQSREMRRMAQEQAMKNMDLQALLIRLQHERELAEKKMKYEAAMQQIRDDKARGVVSSSRWKKMLD